MGPNQTLTEVVSWFFTGGKAARECILFRAEVKKEWSSSSAPPHAFMLWTGTLFKNFF